MLFSDRVGKGVRVAPRDALISLSSSPERLGTAFGVHRALDTAGAIAGPIIAFLILRAAPEAYDAVFVVSFLVALLGLGVLVLFVQNRRQPRHDGPARRCAARSSSSAIATSALFVMGCSSDCSPSPMRSSTSRFEHGSSFQTKYFPLLYVGTAIGYVALAVPIGRLADAPGGRCSSPAMPCCSAPTSCCSERSAAAN